MTQPKPQQNVEVKTGISQELDRFEMWVVGNSKKMVIACVIIVVITAIAATVYHFVKSSEARSVKVFAAAKNSTELEQILAKNPSGAPAAAARRTLAQEKIEKKDYAGAAELLKAAAADNSAESFVRGRSELDAAYCEEKGGKLKEAAELFRKTAGNSLYPEEIRAEGAYALGRILAAEKDYEGARAAFMQASARPSGSAPSLWSTLAVNSLNRLPAPASAK